MSVGHIARGLEDAGIPTVVIAVKSFVTRMQMMSLPRVILTDNLLGRVLGNPHEINEQKRVLLKACEVLQHAEKNGTLVELDK